MTPRAVVFDCDGVLVDSEALAWRAWRAVLKDYGYEPSSDQVQLLLGRSVEEILAYFTAYLEVDHGAEARLDSVMVELFERHLVAYDDGAALVASARAGGFRLAVASSSSRARVIRALELTDLIQFFDVIVTADDAARGKPTPDVYAEAARQLGVSCGECVAIEDSRNGVTSALAAGMPVIAVVRPHTPRESVSGATVVVDSLVPSVLDAEWARC
jgi:putative hydrolase of the HAD superfamily